MQAYDAQLRTVSRELLPNH